jgi:hypothetical protein
MFRASLVAGPTTSGAVVNIPTDGLCWPLPEKPSN